MPPPPPRDRRGPAALVLASVSLVLSLLACGLAIFNTNGAGNDLLPIQSRPQVASASQVEAIAHVTLPPGTVLLSAVYSNGLETRLSAKFRLSRTALDAFMGSGHFTTELTPGLRAITTEHNVGGGNTWDPDLALSVSGLTEQQPSTGGTYRTLMLNLDAPDTITVYLYADRG